MKKVLGAKTGMLAAVAACALVGCMGLAACGGGAVSYADGTYTGQSGVYEDEEEGNGDGYGEITITIEGGKITAAEFNTYEPDGTLKGSDYGMVNGHIGNQDYYNKAQKAVAANPEYAAQLVAVGTPDGVDVISGATISWNEFQDAAYDALSQAEE